MNIQNIAKDYKGSPVSISPRLLILKIFFFQRENKRMSGVSVLVIHPDYYQYTGDTVVGHTDVALIKTTEDVFQVDGNSPNQTDEYPWIVPICLPPKLNYIKGKEEEQTEEGIHEPFEDMDCFQVNIWFPL